MHHGTGNVRCRAERRIPDHVQVREAGQAERVAEATTTGALDDEWGAIATELLDAARKP